MRYTSNSYLSSTVTHQLSLYILSTVTSLSHTLLYLYSNLYKVASPEIYGVVVHHIVNFPRVLEHLIQKYIDDHEVQLSPETKGSKDVEFLWSWDGLSAFNHKNQKQSLTMLYIRLTKFGKQIPQDPLSPFNSVPLVIIGKDELQCRTQLMGKMEDYMKSVQEQAIRIGGMYFKCSFLKGADYKALGFDIGHGMVGMASSCNFCLYNPQCHRQAGMTREEIKESNHFLKGEEDLVENSDHIIDSLHLKIRVINTRLEQLAEAFGSPPSLWGSPPSLWDIIKEKTGVWRAVTGYNGNDVTVILAAYETWLPEVVSDKKSQWYELFALYNHLFPILLSIKPTKDEIESAASLVAQIRDVYKQMDLHAVLYDHHLLWHCVQLMRLHGSLGLYSMQATEHQNKYVKKAFKCHTMPNKREEQTLTNNFLSRLL